MFETGLTDTITIKKPTASGKDANGNPKKTWETIINLQQCRVVEKRAAMKDQAGNLVVVNIRSVGINYSGTDLTPDCEPTINGTLEEITEVKPARGFGRNFHTVVLKGRNE